jgi:uncharacterized protein (DUF433 family)
VASPTTIAACRTVPHRDAPAPPATRTGTGTPNGFEIYCRAYCFRYALMRYESGLQLNSGYVTGTWLRPRDARYRVPRSVDARTRLALGAHRTGAGSYVGLLAHHAPAEKSTSPAEIASFALSKEDLQVPRKLDRITINPAILSGKPCIRGMRLTVRRVLQVVALYPDRAELKKEYPELEDEDVVQALEFAALSLDDEILPLEAA